MTTQGSFTTSGISPQTMPLISEGCAAGDMSKKICVTQDTELQRKERSFHECLEYLMPVYLLPLLIGDKAGACVYCILLTVAGLAERLLPAAVAAMLPIVILPLGDVYGADELAAQYMGDQVLITSLLFAIAIVGDETTLFFRLCLFALNRYALRMQPLFLYMQSLVLALSLILPSTVIMVFSAVFIDRFVSTVSDEIIGADLRMQSASSTPNFNIFQGRFPRSSSRKSSYITFGRRARSVSIASETTIPSENSRGSSVVKNYKLFQGSALLGKSNISGTDDTPQVKKPRKTSFGMVTRSKLNEDRPFYLPVRRIRSLIAEPSQPSSILKRSAAVPTTTPSFPLPLTASVPPSSEIAGKEKCKTAFPIGVSTAMGLPEDGEGQEVLGETPMSTPPTSLAVESPPKGPTPPCNSSAYLQGIENDNQDASPAPEFWTPLTSPLPSTGKTTGTPSPLAKSATSGRRSGSTSPRMAKMKTVAKRRLSQRRNSQARVPAGQQSRIRRQTVSEAPRVEHNSRRSSFSTVRESAHTSLSHTNTTPDTEASLVPKPVLKHGSRAESRSEPVQVQEPVARQEVRGVLKKRTPSVQLSLASRRGSMLNWDPQSQTPLVYAAEPQSVIPRVSPLNDSRTPLEKASSFCLSGQEPQTSSLRMRALILAARPAFIVGVAYTAIFGNLVNLNTLPARKTLLDTLDCPGDDCPVTWGSWLAVSLPVAVICCATCWTCIYFVRLVKCDDDIDEQAHEEMSSNARARYGQLKKLNIMEVLLFYWLLGLPVATCAYNVRHPESRMEGPVLGITLLILAILPGSSLRRCWSYRALSWPNLCSRMPWSVILMLGSVMVLTRTVEEYRLVETGLAMLDDHFWKDRSTKSSQFILVSVAAVLSEVLVGDSLAQLMAPTVVRVAVVKETPVSFYVVPVSLAASINLVLPVSLPLLVMRQYLHTSGSQMVIFGITLKCAAVVIIFISMNTLGLAAFQGISPINAQNVPIGNATNLGIKAPIL